MELLDTDSSRNLMSEQFLNNLFARPNILSSDGVQTLAENSECIP